VVLKQRFCQFIGYTYARKVGKNMTFWQQFGVDDCFGIWKCLPQIVVVRDHDIRAT
jgi:hypothetical protein